MCQESWRSSVAGVHCIVHSQSSELREEMDVGGEIEEVGD